MKFFRYFAFVLVTIALLASCKKQAQKSWDITPKKNLDLVLTDISAELYNPDVPLAQFKKKYPWFQGSVTDAELEMRRKDTTEIKIYEEASAKINQPKLKKDLQSLFDHIQYYFTDFKIPHVYLYSSALQGVIDPILYQNELNILFIDISAFMGEKNPHYKGLENYYLKSMNPSNIVPKVSAIFAEYFTQPDPQHRKFLYQIIYQGKLMMMQDAFLPNYPDYLKINYTQKEYEWAQSNEVNIWDYFVENNMIYNDDPQLKERFISIGPFSKFYTEIDNESSPQIGIYTGWQICKKYFQEKPATKLQDFLKMDAQEIFNQSLYKPKSETQ